MPALDSGEFGFLATWNLDGHYKRFIVKYIYIGRVLVSTVGKIGPIGRLSEDELADALYNYLRGNEEWKKVLRRKQHLPRSDHDRITGYFARHVAWDAYSAIMFYP
jgi:hypothetical protein